MHFQSTGCEPFGGLKVASLKQMNLPELHEQVTVETNDKKDVLCAVTRIEPQHSGFFIFFARRIGPANRSHEMRIVKGIDRKWYETRIAA